jgi:hypothetical protein
VISDLESLGREIYWHNRASDIFNGAFLVSLAGEEREREREWEGCGTEEW